MAKFPDLNKDGKITQADILKAKGVYRHGGRVKKMAGGGNPGMPAKRMGPKPPSMRPKPYDEEFRDKIATPVISDPVKYPEYIEEVGEERISGPRMRKGGVARSSASKRADGIAQRGKTRGKIV